MLESLRHLFQHFAYICPERELSIVELDLQLHERKLFKNGTAGRQREVNAIVGPARLILYRHQMKSLNAITTSI